MNHWVAFLCAGLFGLLLAGPFVYFSLFASPPSVGIYPEFTNDQDFYLSRIQDVRDGHPEGGNTYIAEYKEVPPVQLLVGEWISAGLLELSNRETADGLIGFQLIFPPIVFLLTYAIGICLKAPKTWALLAALFLCVGSMFFVFARLISPQFNFIFWLISVWGLFKLAEKPNWQWALFQTFSVGVLFYIYPYYWTHIGASYAVLVLVSLFINRRLALWSVVSGVGALFVGSGYLFLLTNARSLSWYTETLERLGGVYTRFPSGLVFALSSSVLVAVVLYLSYRMRRLPDSVLVGLSLVAGGIIAMNQQLITGFTLEFASHYKMQLQFGNIFLILAFLSSFGWWPALQKKKILYSVGAFIAIFSFIGVFTPYAAVAEYAKNNERLSSYVPVLEWLQEHASTDEVVYAEEDFAKIIPAYSSQNVFYARNANLFFMPESEVSERAILQNFRGSFSDEFIMDAERELFGQRYMNQYQHATLVQKVFGLIGMEATLPERLPQSAVEEVRATVARLRSMPFSEAISSYRVDYFVVNKEDPYRLTEEDVSFLKLVYETNTYLVYKYEPSL